MNSGHVAKQLGVTTQTIRRWTDRFGEFLSEKNQQNTNYHAVYTDDDLLVLGTVSYLSDQNISMSEIEEQLRSGYRISRDMVEILQEKRHVPPEKAEKILQEGKLANLELQKISLERNYLVENLQKIEAQNAALLQENAELKYQLGMAMGELNILRRLHDRTLAGEK